MEGETEAPSTVMTIEDWSTPSPESVIWSEISVEGLTPVEPLAGLKPEAEGGVVSMGGPELYSKAPISGPEPE